MTLHLLPLPERKRVKADTRALANLRQMVLADLKRNKDELRSETDHAPRHFKERIQYRQTGETA